MGSCSLSHGQSKGEVVEMKSDEEIKAKCIEIDLQAIRTDMPNRELIIIYNQVIIELLLDIRKLCLNVP